LKDSHPQHRIGQPEEVGLLGDRLTLISLMIGVKNINDLLLYKIHY